MRNEYALDHPISRALLDKSQRDKFYLERDDVQERTGIIVEVMSKYKYRFNACLEELNTRHAGLNVVRKINLPESDGEVDFTKLKYLAEKQAKSVHQLEEFYRNNPVPLYVLAGAMNKSMVETMNHVVAGSNLNLKCCVGSDEEKAKAVEALQSVKTIVVDSTAIVTLLFTDHYKDIGQLPVNFVTTEGVLSDLRKTGVLDCDPDAQAGTFSVDGFIPSSPEGVKKAQDALNNLITFIEENWHIESGTSIAVIEDKRREKLLQIFGRAGLEAIMCASQANHPLWTDDLITATFARNEFGCNRVWTQILFDYFTDRAMMPEDANRWLRQKSKMLVLNFGFSS